MTSLAQTTVEEMVPESYQDDSFDIVVRDTRSIAVFWDLSESRQPSSEDARLSLLIDNGTEAAPERLNLSNSTGHMIVPLAEKSRNYGVRIGWENGESFEEIAAESIELPPLQAHHEPNSSIYKGSVFLPRTTAIERRGFRPAAEL